MKPKIYTGKIGEAENFTLTTKTLTGAYVLRNFSSEDDFTIDMSLIKKSSFATAYPEAERIGDDFSFELKDVKSGKVKQSILIEGVYGENGLD